MGVARHGTCRAGKIRNMKVATGIVVDGNVVLEGEALAEGSTVTVLLREDPETFDLTSEAALAVETTALAAREYLSLIHISEPTRPY